MSEHEITSTIVGAALGLPRWSSGEEAWGPGTLHVDRRTRLSGLVRIHSSKDAWHAYYYETYHDYRKATLPSRNHFYDDGIYSVMAEPEPPTRFDLDPRDPTSTFRAIEALRDQTLLDQPAVRRFRDVLGDAFRTCLTAPGDPWESGGSLEAAGDGYVQWTRVAESGTPVHIEVSDGAPYSEPMEPSFVTLLADIGWERPDETFRNGWTRCQSPTELDTATALVARTLVAASGEEAFSLDLLQPTT